MITWQIIGKASGSDHQSNIVSQKEKHDSTRTRPDPNFGGQQGPGPHQNREAISAVQHWGPYIPIHRLNNVTREGG